MAELDTTTSALELSDEDVLNMAVPFEEESSEQEPESQEEPKEEASEKEEQETSESEKEEESEEEVNPDTAMMEAFQKAVKEDKQEEEEKEEITDTSDKEKDQEKVKADKEDKGGDSSESETPTEINYEAEYKKIVAPFRANGKDVQVGNIDDAITLMKMGANYNKKMAGLKPNLKLMKMLGNNDLLNEEKLTYLIDLQKKNPEAIAKFMKDSGIDPLDIDTEKDTEYKPGTYTVDDKEVELDQVLEEIQDTKSFDETINIISTKWDDSSKKVLLADPKLITVINEHVGNGIYGQITNIIESERTLGRLAELSDLEAYKHVGDVLQKQGAFNQQQADQQPEPTDVITNISTNTKKQEDPKLKDRRRAAASPKAASSKSNKPQFDPLSMSDEEFEKAAASMGI